MVKNLCLIISLLISFSLFELRTQTYGPREEFYSKFQIFTDRTSFITGEEIYFVAHPFQLEKENIPVLVYAELVSPQGEFLVSEKFKMDSSGIYGNIHIPDDLSSGYYFIRVYSKTDKQIGPIAYSYQRIKIVNFKKAEVNESPQFIEQMEIRNSPKRKELPLEIQISDTIFQIGDSLNIYFHWKTSFPQDMSAINVSVIPEGTILQDSIFFKIITTENGISNPSPDCSPGLSLSGRITDKQSLAPVSLCKLHISLLSQRKDIAFGYTDMDGRFCFPLPTEYDEEEIFIGILEDQNVSILAEQEFCRKSFHIACPKFEILEPEKGIFLQLAQNKAVSSLISDPFRIESSDTSQKSFYGKADKIVKFDKYIELPSLEEYFLEFLPEVLIKQSDRGKTFQLYGKTGPIGGFPPLLLIDMIPVTQASELLKIPPEKIERIELIHSQYYKGNEVFGGIISLFTHQPGKFTSSIKRNGIFITLPMYSIPLAYPQDRISQEKRIPDTRNTLYWNPFFTITDSRSSHIRFPVGITPGKYQIVLRAFSKSGGTIYTAIKSFRIENSTP